MGGVGLGVNMMQVEVSKYTKGTKENGMPQSFIRYNGNSSRQSSHFVGKHLFDTLLSVNFLEICCK